MFVLCGLPPPHFCNFATFGSILDSKQSINLAQLVSPSVALIAALVFDDFDNDSGF